MSVDAVFSPLVIKLTSAVQDEDVFRVLVRGFAVIEDSLEFHVNAQLAEPLDELSAVPFRHLLTLAVGVGVLTPDQRAGFQRLATLRHKLAHAEREPDSVTVDEIRSIADSFDPQLLASVALHPDTAAGWARRLIVVAFLTAEVGGSAATNLRNRRDAALIREIRGQTQPLSALVAAALARPDRAVEHGE